MNKKLGIIRNRFDVYVGLIEGRQEVRLDSWTHDIDSSLEVKLEDQEVITIVDDKMDYIDFIEINGKFYNVEEEQDRIYELLVYGGSNHD